MCAQFTLKIKANQLSLKYGIKVPENLDEINERFLPYKTAPTVVRDKEKNLKLFPMGFSLVPSWSKDPKVKFATHNARIETVKEKPTWRVPFEKNHCLIPMTSFYESVYEGPKAGHVIEFSPKKEELLFAAGIFDIWKDKEKKDDKSLFTFSILTSEPTQFIMDYGHDRSPIFLKFDDAKEWFNRHGDVDFLMSKNQKPELVVEIDRPLKAGWEKRK